MKGALYLRVNENELELFQFLFFSRKIRQGLNLCIRKLFKEYYVGYLGK